MDGNRTAVAGRVIQFSQSPCFTGGNWNPERGADLQPMVTQLEVDTRARTQYSFLPSGLVLSPRVSLPFQEAFSPLSRADAYEQALL